LSGPVGDKAVTRESGADGANVFTALEREVCVPTEFPRLETAPEATVKTVSSSISASRKSISPTSTPRLRQAPSFVRRLSRFTRAKGSHRPPLAFQDRDRELLRTAYDFRLITTVQYLKLFSDESRDGIYRRLQKLFHHAYLDRLGTNPNAPLLYALSRRGADALELPFREASGERYIAHQLMIGDFRIALARAAVAHGIEFDWRRVRHDSAVRPDGYFSLQFPWLAPGQNRAFFFLEVDRSTMTRERFVDKLGAYWSWHEACGHTRVYEIRNFRVLTVTKSEERLASLLSAVAGALDRRHRARHFYFTSERRFAGAAHASILEAIWHNAEGERCGLAS